MSKEEAFPQATHNLVRRLETGAALLGSVLAFGGALAQPSPAAAHGKAQSHSIAKPYAPIPKNESFGIGGVNVSNTGTNLQSTPYFNELAGPYSTYPNSRLHFIVHDGDLADGEQQISDGLTYAEQYMGYNPSVNKEAPIDVSTVVNNADEQKANGGKNICDGAPNTLFSLKGCEDLALHMERTTLYHLMRKFPMVKMFTDQNEPENGAQVSSSNEGGPKFAAKMWQVANGIATILHNNQVVAPGEFWAFPSGYVDQYYKNLARIITKNHLAWPKAEALHLYLPVTCNDSRPLKSILNTYKKYGFYTPMQKGLGIIGTESAVWLSSHLSCANAVAMANEKHKNTAMLTAPDLGKMATAQFLASWAMLDIGNVDPKIRIRQDAYDPMGTSVMCWHGGSWDTSWVAPNGKSGNLTSMPDGAAILGSPRIANYIMTHQKVPSWMFNPQTLQQMQADELALIPPINWTGSVQGSCKYGQVLDGSNSLVKAASASKIYKNVAYSNYERKTNKRTQTTAPN